MKTELHCSQPVSELPAFNLPLAMESKQQADRLLAPYMDSIPSRLSSLGVATTLALYNFENNVPTSQKGALRPVLRGRLLDMARKEVAAVGIEPLPTIGFEIETPLKPFKDRREIFANGYSTFFDSIGIPRNFVNSNGLIEDDAVEYWEFAPAPSYSAGVQQRIISELIQGSFIPHLTSSQKPEEIQRLLDDHLVSLHVNIGIPSNADVNSGLPAKQADILGTALSIAYTSPLRIEHRKQKQTQFAKTKSGVKTLKSFDPYTPQYRIEMKAMEARTDATYRTLLTSQLLFASLFSQHSLSPDPELSQMARITTKGIQLLTNYYFSSNYCTNPADNNYEVARLAARGDTAISMRRFLESQAREVASYLNSLEPQPPLGE